MCRFGAISLEIFAGGKKGKMLSFQLPIIPFLVKILGNISLMRFTDKGLVGLPVDIIMLISFYLQDDSFSISPPFLIKQWTSAAAVAEDHAFKIPPPPPCATMIPVLFLLTASFAHAPRFTLTHARHHRAHLVLF